MISKAQVKYIRSLSHQKYRRIHKAFVVEGHKMAEEWLLSGGRIELVAATEEWIDTHRDLLPGKSGTPFLQVSSSQLEAISQLKAPPPVLLVAAIPERGVPRPCTEWVILADGIQDPGNMGSIVRIADWFGIKYIVTSPDTVDVWHPRVVQAGMGSHLRVSFLETALPEFCKELAIPVLAATLDGASVYDAGPFPAAALIIGNEGRGIRPELSHLADHLITIPRTGGAESLNAAVSSGILCAILKRPL